MLRQRPYTAHGGANGVIIVTTKQGQLSEKMSVDIRFDNTFSMPTYVQKMADGPTYMDMYNEAVYNQAISNNQEYEPFYSRDKIDKTRANANPYLFPNNDWYSMLFKDFAVNQNLNISIKGGSKNVDYFLNAGIFYENGIIRQPKEDKLDVGMRNKKYLFQSNVTARVTSTTKVGLKYEYAVVLPPCPQNKYPEFVRLFHAWESRTFSCYTSC